MNHLLSSWRRPLIVFGVALLVLAACTAQVSSPGDADHEDIPAALNQQQILATQLQIDPSEVAISAVEAVTWPDACLGVPSPVELCAAAETPGYRITLTSVHGTYVYHTNEDGSYVRLASAPQPNGAALISWSFSDDEGCTSAQINGDRLAFGRCLSAQLDMPLVNEDRRADVAELTRTFAPFTADTPAGEVKFSGSGTVKAKPAQQRMIAEWARLVVDEARTGRTGASWGLALAWHREGGEIYICEDASVYRDGTLYVSPCGPAVTSPVNRSRLGAADLARLYSWLDTYANFEQEWNDDADVDGMMTSLVFTGQGETVAHESDQMLMADFALNLYLEGTLAIIPSPASCAGPEEGQQQLLHEAHNYCLLYPAQYSLWNFGPDTTEIISQTVMNHITPRVSITVEPANGRSLDEAVGAFLANYGLPAGEIKQENLIVGERDAIMLDEMPGADFNRQLFLVDDDRLYTISVAPLGDPGSDTRRQADELYNMVAATFRILSDDAGSGVDEAQIDSLSVQMLESFPLQVQVIVNGHLPDACSFIEHIDVARESTTFRIRLQTARHPNMRCAQVLTPFEETIPLDVKDLPAGTYDVRLGDLSEPFTLAVDNTAGSD